MHAEALDFLTMVRDQYPIPPGLILEYGGRNINGSARPLFEDALHPYISIDIADGAGVDVVADALAYDPSEPPVAIICTEVLEHTADAGQICRRALSILQPDGLLVITAAGSGRAPHSAVDGGPLRAGEFFQTLNRQGLETWLTRNDSGEPVDITSHLIIENTKSCDVYAVIRKAGEAA